VITGKPTDDRRRFARGQKFTLSAAGTEAETAYRGAVLAARSSGRAALEAALLAWAEPRRVAPGDGVILAELSGKRAGFGQLCEALETSGLAPDEIRAGVGRLLDAGIVELVPLPSRLLGGEPR
jgi:hypothetical protein